MPQRHLQTEKQELGIGFEQISHSHIDLEEEHETAQQSVKHVGERHEQEVKAEPVGFAEDYEVLIDVSDEEPNGIVRFRCGGSVS